MSQQTAAVPMRNPRAPLMFPDDAYNRRLIENVHPPAWVNPRPAGRYNLVVLGAGTAGLVSAAGAAGLGARVALVERHLTGGDCLNYGCVPSKGMLRAAHAVQAVREADVFGIQAKGAIAADFGAAMERMRRVRSEISANDSAHRMAKLGVHVFLGQARFLGPDAIDVDGQPLTFSRAIIATGGRPSGLPVPGLEDAGFLTNETVFSLTEAPRRLVVIGGGPIGCELAQAFRHFGSEVSIVSRNRLLPREDEDTSRLLTARFEKDGIRLRLGVKVIRVEPTSSGKALTLERDKGHETLEGDELLVAIGRSPNTEGLNLEGAGIAFDKEGIKVDDHLQTTNAHVYAAGDICSKSKFTHTADAMARIAIQNALFFGRKKVSELVIPWCTYTRPEVAHVGLYAKEAKQRGIEVASYSLELKEVDRALLDGEEEGFARVHAEQRGGRIVGATLVARHAGEMIGEMALAITAGLRLSDVARTIHPYPTQAEVWKRLGDQYMRSRLSPRLRGWLERYFRWRR